ncbi:hypothetical protein G3I43_07260 [Streptomyces anulatus]|uniref:Uncharacterized protein n=1 Tax=Streptomyces anulatus TaxID=1892 RepID=A0A6G3SLU2_STRAQ|nr:hypothetical protein [Streptomyces anulatus]NEB83976.1 hypothetical protein [Streptomyces anulatus]
MAEINPPAWMQAGAYPARTDRLILSSLLSYPGFAVDEPTPMRIRQGVKPSYQQQQLKVRAAPTPNMTVIVSAGFCFVDNHDSGGLGTYVLVNDSDETLTVQPAGGAGQYRRDCVVASVYDAETAGSVSEWRLEVIQGTYAASAGAAVRPSLPSNCSLLADLTIAPSQTSVASGQIFDVRNFSVASGGILPVGSTNALTRPHPGQMMYLTNTDTFVYGKQDGTTGTLVQQGWTAYTPTWTAAVSNPAIGNGLLRGAWMRSGKTISLRIHMVAGSSTTYGSGAWRFALPAPPFTLDSSSMYHVGSAMLIDQSTGADYPGTCFCNATDQFLGVSTAIGGSSAQPGAVAATVPFTWANGDSLHLQITYEVQ